MKMLIISNDDRTYGEIGVVLGLRYRDLDIDKAVTGLEGFEIIKSHLHDLVLIDGALPDVSTVDIVRDIRDYSEVGIIFLCEKQSEIVRAEILEAGADDYVYKPLEYVEFLARIKALLRRLNGHKFVEHNQIKLADDLFVDVETREVHANGKTSKLTHTEFLLLNVLMNNSGKMITNNKIIEKIWGVDDIYYQDSVKKYIHRLRSKIEPDPGNPQIILNERGIGYGIVTSHR